MFLTQKAAPILGSKKRPQKRAPPAPVLKKDYEQLRRPPFWGPRSGPQNGGRFALHFANKRAPPALRRNCGRSVLATTSTLRSCATHDGRLPHTSSNWGGPSTRPQIWSGFWTQFWGPPAQCVSPRVSAKSQNQSAASPAPPRRSAPIELQTKAVWPNVRGIIFVARDTGIQGPYSATPSGIRTLKKPKENKRFSKEPRNTKLGRSTFCVWRQKLSLS